MRWAEQQKDPVSIQSLAAARRNSGPLTRLAEDPEVLSYHLWGFLNGSLIDDAWAIFSGVMIENGFEVWRTVVLATTQKSQAEVLRLEDSVLMPDRVRSASDIEKALVEWDALYREYTEAGGCPLSDHRKVGVLMRLLPTILHDDILKEFGRFDNKPDDLRRWIRDRVQWLKWNDSPTRKHHLLDGDDEGAATDDSELAAYAEIAALAKSGAPEEELHAFIRRKFPPKNAKGSGKGRPAPDRERPARSKADTTCPNCLTKGHTAQECTKPKVAVKDRACFNCGEVGHTSARCPKGKLKALVREPNPTRTPNRQPAPKYTLCLDGDGFTPSHRLAQKPTPWNRAIAKPSPKGLTVGDVLESTFSKLRRLEASERPAETKVEAPPEPPQEVQKRPTSVKRRPHFRECTCPNVKNGCCDNSTKLAYARQLATGPNLAYTPQLTTDPKLTRPMTNVRALVEQVKPELCSFYGIEDDAEEAHVLEELEFFITEMTLDTGATTHAADRIDFPGQTVQESAGSKAGQTFGCAGGKKLANEGEVHISMIAPGGIECELGTTVQITKITRPLLSVTQMIKNGDITVVCKKDEAVILSADHQVLALFKRKGGVYVADMKVRNPKFKPPFGGPAR